MKRILLGLLVLLSVSLSAQVKRDNFIDKFAGNLKITYQRISNLDNGDTKYYVFLSFQNINNRLIDIKTVALFSIADMEVCVKDMKSVFRQMSTSEKVNMDWTRDKYKITLYDFTNKMHFTEPRTGGSTTISKRNVSDLLEIMSTIDFGKETLLPSKTIYELVP